MNWVDETWAKVEEKLSVVAVRSRDKIPFHSKDGLHDDTKEDGINCWTNGFWPGLMWLMYSATGKEDYGKTAEHIENLLDRAFMNFDKLGHDVGFMWRLASGADYQLTGSEKAKNRQSIAANHLMARFNPTGEFLRALCEDWLPRQDLRAPEEGIFDASAGLIAVCGMIEIAKLVPEYEKKLY